MKKTISFLIIVFLCSFIANGQGHSLKLRTSYNPGLLRIVLEGGEEIIGKATVNQKGQNIIVVFPGADFQIQEEKTTVNFKKTEKSTIIFSPGSFRGFKVLNLQNPSRLVIDVYQLDVKKEGKDQTLPPAAGLKPATTKTGAIVIDPGHGGFDSGIEKNNLVEKSLSLDIAKRLGALAEQGTYKVYLTRNSDLFMPLSERVKYANSREADLFISLHAGNHKEIVIYFPVVSDTVPDDIKQYLQNRGQEGYLKKTISFLNAVKEAVSGELGSDMVTVKPLPYSMLSKIEAAALMIEMPSPDSDYSEDMKVKIANVLYKGIYLYEEEEIK